MACISPPLCLDPLKKFGDINVSAFAWPVFNQLGDGRQSRTLKYVFVCSVLGTSILFDQVSRHAPRQ